MNDVLEKVNLYRTINDITLQGEVVIFGADFMADFPFYELSQKYLFSAALYNRSLHGLTLPLADRYLKECVLDIHPSKVFFALGENDLEDPNAMERYRKLIMRTQRALPRASLYLLPVPETTPAAKKFNIELLRLGTELELNCPSLCYDTKANLPQYSKIFKKLTVLFRSGNLDLTEVFALAN